MKLLTTLLLLLLLASLCATAQEGDGRAVVNHDSLHGFVDCQGVEVLHKSPRWAPATMDGKLVAVRYDLFHYFNFR